MNENPFLTPYDTIPFEHIRLEDFEPAILEGMKREVADHERCVTNPDAPTFDNTIIDYDADRTLERACTVLSTLQSVVSSDELEALAQRMQPMLTEHSSKLTLDERLWKRVKAVHDNPDRAYTPDEQRLLDDTYEGFVRAGALLPEDKKEELKQLRVELGQASLIFHQNLLKATSEFQLLLTTEEELAGLPDRVRESARQAAQEKGQEGWLITLQQPSVGPFLTYSDRADLRKKVYLAHASIAAHEESQWNNLPLVPTIVNLHRRMANLLGYECYADLVLEKRMAENKQNVYKLLSQLFEAYYPVAVKERKELKDFAKELEGKDFEMQPWDVAYYTHKLQKARYDLDSEMLRPYLELSRVKEGVFGLATTLYGITFHKRTDVEVYHPEVEVWDVLDEDGTSLGLLYTDFHPRETKQSGAWENTFREQWLNKEGKDIRPHATVVMNFTRPTDTKPALLSLNEVNTFLHEFGHALHSLFSKVRFASQSCNNVYWDFVELPSQIMENFTNEPAFLNTFARHYETGEPLPQELIDRVRRAQNFMAATACIRQVKFGMLDMAYYTLTQDFDADPRDFEKEVWQPIEYLQYVPGECMSTHFSHIMCGGYSAGYYSYKWAEVLDADAFSVFQQNGIFDRETARRFREEILSKGGTKHPMELYKNFRGQEPTIEALMRRDGITPPLPSPAGEGEE